MLLLEDVGQICAASVERLDEPGLDRHTLLTLATRLDLVAWRLWKAVDRTASIDGITAQAHLDGAGLQLAWARHHRADASEAELQRRLNLAAFELRTVFRLLATAAAERPRARLVRLRPAPVQRLRS